MKIPVLFSMLIAATSITFTSCVTTPDSVKETAAYQEARAEKEESDKKLRDRRMNYHVRRAR